jgi:hypothetical protein
LNQIARRKIFLGISSLGKKYAVNGKKEIALAPAARGKLSTRDAFSGVF